MSWLPTFLNLPTALLAAAVAVPALLLLYFLKLRRQVRPVSSTILWRKAVQDLQVNSPFQRLRRNLLLLLQLLILAAVLLALADPITFHRPGAALDTVILLDHSASMNARDGDAAGGRTRLDEAKRRATALVDDLPRGGRAMVISFDDTAETLQPYTADVPALERAIDGVRPTDRPTAFKLAYQLADAQSVATEDGGARQRVFLFSDGRAADAADVSLRGELRYEAVGDPRSKNVGIVSMSAKRNYETPTQVQVYARLANAGPEPVDADVVLSVAPLDASSATDAYRVRQVKSGLKLLPVRWSDARRAEAEKAGLVNADGVEFAFELTTAAVIKIEQTNKDGDVLAADDTACVVVPPPKPLNVAVVTEGNYFLERAVASLGLKDVKTLTPADYESRPPGDVDVVLFDRYAPRTTPAAGNFIYFDALPEGLSLKRTTDAQGRSLSEKSQRVLDWKRDHPLLQDLPLRKLYAEDVMRLTVPMGDETLIDGDDTPLVVLDHTGRSTNLVVAFDALQSNWPLSPSYPMFLQRALQFLSAGSHLSVRESFTPGDSPRLPRANLDRAGGDMKRLTVVGPDGRTTVDVPPAGDFALPPLQRVGVYTTDPVVPQYERLAVNLLSDTESNVLPTDTAPGNAGPAKAADAGRTPLQWWWWLLAAGGVPLLLVEWWVYARRVHA